MPSSKKKPASPAPTGEKKPVDPSPPVEPPDLWKLIQTWVWRRFGWAGLVIITAFIVGWSQWDRISKLPGIEPLVAYVSAKPLPKAEPGKFNVAVAHLEGDDNHANERLVRDSLYDELPFVNTQPFDRLISPEPDEGAGHKRAQAILKTSGFDVLIWGDCLTDVGRSDKSRLRLHLTVAPDETKKLSAGRYQAADDLNLPSLFWHDLTDVLGLVLAARQAEFLAQEGHYQAATLAPFIDRVRTLLQSSTADQWNAATRADVQVILAIALFKYGEESGANEPLLEAISLYNAALKERTREKAPLAWALTQHNLGSALRVLGERESDQTRLTDAVAAYQEALKEWTREKTPLQWAMTQTSLGSALSILGSRRSDPALLKEAVASFHEALTELKREKLPLDWASVQYSLGTALDDLGQIESDSARFKEAEAAYREALKEQTREKVPVEWATTQNNLGNVLVDLGGDPNWDPVLLTDAVAAYREALKERTREKAPFDWAMTQSNLGTALAYLGKRDSDPARLIEAVAAFREALTIRTREKVPLDWASGQYNIGSTLHVLGVRQSNPDRLTEAVAAFREALKEETLERVPLDWAMTQNNLGNTLQDLATLKSDVGSLKEAAIAYRAAALGFHAAKSDHYSQLAEGNLQQVQKQINHQ